MKIYHRKGLKHITILGGRSYASIYLIALQLLDIAIWLQTHYTILNFSSLLEGEGILNCAFSSYDSEDKKIISKHLGSVTDFRLIVDTTI